MAKRDFRRAFNKAVSRIVDLTRVSNSDPQSLLYGQSILVSGVVGSGTVPFREKVIIRRCPT